MFHWMKNYLCCTRWCRGVYEVSTICTVYYNIYHNKYHNVYQCVPQQVPQRIPQCEPMCTTKRTTTRTTMWRDTCTRWCCFIQHVPQCVSQHLYTVMSPSTTTSTTTRPQCEGIPVHGDVSHLLTKFPHSSCYSCSHSRSQGRHLAKCNSWIISRRRWCIVFELNAHTCRLWNNFEGKSVKGTSFIAGLATSQPSRLACSCSRSGEPVIPDVLRGVIDSLLLYVHIIITLKQLKLKEPCIGTYLGIFKLIPLILVFLF